MADKIIIKKLSVPCLIGVYPEEKTKAQEVVIDLELSCDLSLAASTDNIEDSIDYASLESQIIETCRKKSRSLLEKLAEDIANKCLQDQRVTEVKLKVKKPSALKNAKYAAVEIIRKQG